MNVTRHRISATIASTAYDGITELPVNGRVLQIQYTPAGSPIDTNADIIITGKTTAVPILTKANIGTSLVSWAPRQPTHKVADGAALVYAGTDGVCEPVVLAGEHIRLQIANGGAGTPSGTFDIWVG